MISKKPRDQSGKNLLNKALRSINSDSNRQTSFGLLKA
ncbi:hypothetical protein EV13_2415 [Prochlorococcus sp. MIT 0702]|nr:hypothetical protein EV13_2415 [Prochlorococcus sp. MIT 0702]